MWDSSYRPGQRPLFYMGQMPVHLTTLIILVHVAMIVFVAILGGGFERMLAFTTTEVLFEAKLWKLITYAFVIPAGAIFFVAIGLVFFYMFGRQVENYLGLHDYFKLYAILLLVPPVFLCVVDLLLRVILGMNVGPFSMATSASLHLCIFLAFVFIYPNALFFFGFLAKWVATFFVAVHTLQLLAIREWTEFSMMWFRILLTYVMLRRFGLMARFPQLEAPFLNLRKQRKPKAYRHSQRKLKVVKGDVVKGSVSSAPRTSRYESKLAPKLKLPEGDPTMASIDHLLDKISRQGLASLTEDERRQLENARTNLMDKDQSPS